MFLGEKYEKIISWLIVVITVFPLLTTGVNCNADNRSKNYTYTIESTKTLGSSISIVLFILIKFNQHGISHIFGLNKFIILIIVLPSAGILINVSFARGFT